MTDENTKITRQGKGIP